MVKRIALLALVLVGCNKSSGLVVVGVSSSAPLGSIAHLQIYANDAAHMSMVGNGVTLPTTFGIEMPRGFTGRLALIVTALDADSRALGSGTGEAMITPGERSDMTITLEPTAPPPPPDMAAPADLATPPDLALACANAGQPCTTGSGACAVTGKIVCADGVPACTAVAGVPDNSGTWHLSPAANGSWDWDCDGMIQFQYPNGTTLAPTPNPSAGDGSDECALFTLIATCNGDHWHYSGPTQRPLSCGQPKQTISTVCGWVSGSCAWGGFRNETQGCH